MGKATALYQNLPPALQNLAVSAFGYLESRKRYGKINSSPYDRLLNIEPHEVDQLVQKRLQKLLTYCGESIPYYRNHISKNNVPIDEVTPENLGEFFPVLEKQQLKSNPTEFIPADIGNARKLHTSGTTGSPLDVYYSLEERRINYMFFSKLLAQFGCHSKSRKIIFAGRTLLNKNPQDVFWRSDFFNNSLYMSSYHISDVTTERYIDKMISWQPEYIDAYPSTVVEIAKYCLKNNIALKDKLKLKLLLTSSETLSDQSRAMLKTVFDCPLADQYGCTEMAVFGYKSGDHFSFEPLYSITELVPTVTEGIYELVTTGLVNFTMPLIRYKIGDAVYAAESSDGELLCKSIVGRLDDLIVTPEGRKIGRMDPVFKGVEGIKESQIIQWTTDRLEVLVVLDSDTRGSFVAETLIGNIKDRTSENMQVDVSVKDAIPISSNGKFRAVVSKIQH